MKNKDKQVYKFFGEKELNFLREIYKNTSDSKGLGISVVALAPNKNTKYLAIPIDRIFQKDEKVIKEIQEFIAINGNYTFYFTKHLHFLNLLENENPSEKTMSKRVSFVVFDYDLKLAHSKKSYPVILDEDFDNFLEKIKEKAKIIVDNLKERIKWKYNFSGKIKIYAVFSGSGLHFYFVIPKELNLTKKSENFLFKALVSLLKKLMPNEFYIDNYKFELDQNFRENTILIKLPGTPVIKYRFKESVPFSEILFSEEIKFEEAKYSFKKFVLEFLQEKIKSVSEIEDYELMFAYKVGFWFYYNLLEKNSIFSKYHVISDYAMQNLERKIYGVSLEDLMRGYIEVEEPIIKINEIKRKKGDISKWLYPFFKKWISTIKEINGSRQIFLTAVHSYLLKYLELDEKTSIELLKPVLERLVEDGLEDPRDVQTQRIIAIIRNCKRKQENELLSFKNLLSKSIDDDELIENIKKDLDLMISQNLDIKKRIEVKKEKINKPIELKDEFVEFETYRIYKKIRGRILLIKFHVNAKKINKYRLSEKIVLSYYATVSATRVEIFEKESNKNYSIGEKKVSLGFFTLPMFRSKYLDLDEVNIMNLFEEEVQKETIKTLDMLSYVNFKDKSKSLVLEDVMADDDKLMRLMRKSVDSLSDYKGDYSKILRIILNNSQEMNEVRVPFFGIVGGKIGVLTPRNSIIKSLPLFLNSKEFVNKYIVFYKKLFENGKETKNIILRDVAEKLMKFFEYDPLSKFVFEFTLASLFRIPIMVQQKLNVFPSVLMVGMSGFGKTSRGDFLSQIVTFHSDYVSESTFGGSGIRYESLHYIVAPLHVDERKTLKKLVEDLKDQSTKPFLSNTKYSQNLDVAQKILLVRNLFITTNKFRLDDEALEDRFFVIDIDNTEIKNMVNYNSDAKKLYFELKKKVQYVGLSVYEEWKDYIDLVETMEQYDRVDSLKGFLEFSGSIAKRFFTKYLGEEGSLKYVPVIESKLGRILLREKTAEGVLLESQKLWLFVRDKIIKKFQENHLLKTFSKWIPRLIKIPRSEIQMLGDEVDELNEIFSTLRVLGIGFEARLVKENNVQFYKFYLLLLREFLDKNIKEDFGISSLDKLRKLLNKDKEFSKYLIRFSNDDQENNESYRIVSRIIKDEGNNKLKKERVKNAIRIDFSLFLGEDVEQEGGVEIE